MSKKRKTFIAGILLVITAIFIWLKYLIPNHDLFSYNLMEILTTIVVTIAIFFLTKANDDIKNKNDKIEDIIELLKNSIYTFSSAIFVYQITFLNVSLRYIVYQNPFL